jgi:predicted TIM-barrel fold metal-dependent hydrolase
MALQELAATVYSILRRRVLKERDPRMSYDVLAKELGPGMVARNSYVTDALYEIGRECVALGLPVITGIVVKTKNGKPDVPSEGYFHVAHPDAPASEWASKFTLDRIAISQAKEKYPEAL